MRDTDGAEDHCWSLPSNGLYTAPMCRPPRLRGTLALGALVALGSLGAAVVVPLWGARALADASRERRFFSARQGVGVEAPMGWTLSLHTGYPEILCVLLHPDGSRISLSAALTKVADARALAEQSRRGLEAQHLAITRLGPGPRGGVLVEAHGAARAAELRQLYLVRPMGVGKSQAVVLTLSTRSETLATAGSAFDWAVAHIALEAPAGTEAPGPDGGVRAGR
jgi:hypothetical protein